MSKEDRYAHLNQTDEELTADSESEDDVDPEEKEPDDDTDVVGEQIDTGVSVTVRNDDEEHVVEFDSEDVTVDEVLARLEETDEVDLDQDAEPVVVGDAPEGVARSMIKAQKAAAMVPFRVSTKTAKTAVAGTVAAGALFWAHRRRRTEE